MDAEDLVFSFLKYFPTFGIIPIIFSFIALFFFYLSFKICDCSKPSLKLGISSLLIVPAAAAFSSQILISPLTKLAADYSGSEKIFPSQPLSQRGLRFDDPIFILAIISVVLLAVSFKKFHFKTSSISKKAKIFLALITTIFVVPIVSIISLEYVKAQNTDYGYSKAVETVGHHIYRPSSVPSGLTYATKFVLGKELAGKQTAIQVAYDIPFDMLIKGEQTEPIVVKQVEVEIGFDVMNLLQRTRRMLARKKSIYQGL